MLKNKILCVIPARGGSKEIPDKNIIHLNDKPLINWTIEAAINSKFISKIIVSTDSNEIAKISLLAGAEVPFIRPKELSTDGASSMSVIKHAVDFFSYQGEIYDLVVMLQPTSPLRNSDDIDKAIESYLKHRKGKEATLVSCCSVNSKYNWIMEKKDNRAVFVNNNLPVNLSRQELNLLFLPNGAIFIANTKNLQESFYTSDIIMYEMKESHSVDIDTLKDLQAAHDYIVKDKMDSSNGLY
jgi:CMP-N,N'-diacetyllegionaminic acid synthase